MEKTKKSAVERCCDCKKKVMVDGEELINAKLLKYDNGGEKITVIKCDKCFKKNPSLTNYQKCEVYSRIVGYIRPVQQWNLGKMVEYSEREEYKTKNDK